MIEYSDKGNGFPIVLLHGFCESKEIWKESERELSKKYRVICPDLPGFGETRAELIEVTMEYFAQKIKKLLDGLKISKCILIGHSLGGYVALAFAEKYENYLAGFGLFHSTAFADTEEKKESRNKTIEFIEKYGVNVFAESFVPPLFSLKSKEKFKHEISELIKMATTSSLEGVVETTKAMRDRIDRTYVLRQSAVPVLFIAGKLDGAVPIEKTMEQCSLPKQSIVYIIDGVGHMGMVEANVQTTKMIKTFADFCL